MTGLFDPARYAKVRLPLLDAETLPPDAYTEPAFFARERERIFRMHWNLACRAGDISEPGDYCTVDLAGMPAIVLRGADGALRAFANTCRHRGSRLVSGSGNAKAISCPYHGWSYALDGRLVAAAGMERAKSFDSAEFGLIPLRLAEWAGFVFLNFADDGAGLDDHLGNLPEELHSHQAEGMICVHRRAYDVACNWKLCMENQRESYHVAVVHRGTLAEQLPEQLAASGHWSGSWFGHQGSIAARLGAAKTLPPIPTLEGRAAEGTFFVGLYPASFLVFTVDCMWWMSFRPLAADRTQVLTGLCFPETVTKRADFAAIVGNYIARTDASHPEDNRATEMQQRGLASPHARPGRFSHREAGVHAVDNWILDRVLDDPQRDDRITDSTLPA
ncbi:MAG: aromatic ring-hydroxylating dioxygenase subunit alpha [Defluviicoccus sp.]|nr:aromatic ring-hydroxylating dioxygenase subunit alpha [Defluviicoccus sp.]MDE0384146.1 aromatic ring-hydroxylating dioxygenase subunit alpha [Defluviicoccus sp.]